MPVSKNRRKRGKKAAKKKAVITPSARSSGGVGNAVGEQLGRFVGGDGRQTLLIPNEFAAGWYEEKTMPGETEHEAMERAQEMIYDAWDSPNKRARIDLARTALKVSELCADAWLVLANDEAKGLIEERAYCQRALHAGEAALGPEVFEQDVGHFWGLYETRPYMRARAQLSDCLWRLGDRKECIAHLRDMLRLNPNDNQGLRYILTSRLLNLDMLEAAETLLADYEEDGFADWAYNNALVRFKKFGQSDVADAAAKAAGETNAHVVFLLLEEKPMPRTLPPHYSPGSKEEAVLYVNANAQNWQATQGALEWLHETTKNIRPRPKARR